MTANEFRALALAIEGASESAHMGHPDFRINGKIFATLGHPNENWGMVKLSPEQQNEFAQSQPKSFIPAKGAWGRQGSTTVLLEQVEAHSLQEALRIAAALTAKARAVRKKSRSGQGIR